MVMARLDGNVGIRYELHVSWGCGFAIKCIVVGAISFLKTNCNAKPIFNAQMVVL